MSESEKYSDEILDSLTDEERAALEEPDDTTTTMGDSINAKDDEAAQGGEGEATGQDADDGEASAKGGGDDGADAGAGRDGADAGSSDADADDDNRAANQPAPLLIADAPADADAKLAEIGTKKNDLIEQFDNGDITAKEYQTGLDALNKEERTIERALEKAQIAAELRQQQEVNNWMAQVQSFTTEDHPEYSTSRLRWMALDTLVKEIGADPANANMTGAAILEAAHKRVVEDLGEAGPAAKTVRKDGAPLKGSKAAPPKTLAKVPASDNTDVNDGRWAALDRLRDADPLAHEEKLMKLSDSERDEYLARA